MQKGIVFSQGAQTISNRRHDVSYINTLLVHPSVGYLGNQKGEGTGLPNISVCFGLLEMSNVYDTFLNEFCIDKRCCKEQVQYCFEWEPIYEDTYVRTNGSIKDDVTHPGADAATVV